MTLHPWACFTVFLGIFVELSKWGRLKNVRSSSYTERAYPSKTAFLEPFSGTQGFVPRKRTAGSPENFHPKFWNTENQIVFTIQTSPYDLWGFYLSWIRVFLVSNKKTITKNSWPRFETKHAPGPFSPPPKKKQKTTTKRNRRQQQRHHLQAGEAIDRGWHDFVHCDEGTLRSSGFVDPKTTPSVFAAGMSRKTGCADKNEGKEIPPRGWGEESRNWGSFFFLRKGTEKVGDPWSGCFFFV